MVIFWLSCFSWRLGRYDIDVSVKEVEERQRIAILKTLHEAVRIQSDLYRAGMERMEACSAELARLTTTVGGVRLVNSRLNANALVSSSPFLRLIMYSLCFDLRGRCNA